MTVQLGIDFQPYLRAILTDEDYREWQDLYTPTTVEDRRRKPAPDTTAISPRRFSSRLKLRAEIVKPDKQEQGDRPDGAQEPQEDVKQWNVLAGLREYAAEHVVLIGKPGSGKSTSLERLLWEEARKAQQDPNARIPVLVKLRRCTGMIEELIRNFLVGHQVALEIAQIEELLCQGRFLLLLDGLNELPEAFKTEVMNFRDRYRRTTPMIVSTRDLGGGGTLGIEKTLKMLPLSEPQMREFVRGYLPEEGDRLLQQLQGDRLRKFAETPLLLWMLCRVFAQSGRVPANLGLAFREFAQLHDKELQADAPVDSHDRWHRLLRHLAFVMMQGETPTEFRLSMPREEAENCLTAYLQGDRSNPRDCAERWLKDLLQYHLIQPVIQPNLEEHIEFRHQLIQEYYAAEYLLKLLPNLTEEQLKQDYLNYLKWTEPIALMLALEDKEVQALRVVRLAMEEVDLLLGARLAGEVKPIFQATTVGWIDAKTLPGQLKVQCWKVSHSKKAVDSLLGALQDSDEDVREIAVEALGEIGDEKAVDGLLRALQGLNYRVRWRAAYALGEIGDEKAVDGLLDALQDSNEDVRERAAEALRELGDEKAVDKLLSALQDSNYRVRWRAAYALGELGDKKAVDGLLRALQDSNYRVRSNTVLALGKLSDKKAVNGLLSALQDSNEDVRERAAYVLGKLGDKKAVDGLLGALQDSKYRVRSNAALALGELGDKKAVDGLLGALQNYSYYRVRSNAALALGELGDEKAVDGLLRALQDLYYDVRERAAEALGKIGGKKAVDGLLGTLQNLNDLMLWRVAAALGKIGGEKAVDVLLSALQGSNYRVRWREAYVLWRIGGEKAVDGLLGALQNYSYYDVPEIAAYALWEIGGEKFDRLLSVLQNSDEDVRWSTAGVLGELSGEKAVDGLLGALQDSKYRVRARAAEALGEIVGEKAVDGLLGALQDSNNDVRSNAAYALGKLGDKKAVDGLLRALQDSDDDVRGNAVGALGKLGDKKAVDGLLGALQDSDDDVHGRAAEALGKIGSARRLADMWQLYRQRLDWNLLDAIAAIQNRCQFYNYEIWQNAIQRSQLEKQDEGRKPMAEQPSISITGGTFNAPLNLASNYGNQPTTIIGTQHNYFGLDDSLNQEIADLQQFIATLEAKHPDLKTEQEAEQVVTTAITEVQTQQPSFWQKLRHQMGVLKQQVFNPERHKQAAKATVVEVAKAAWEKSLIAKAIITYLDKLSETPEQGN